LALTLVLALDVAVPATVSAGSEAPSTGDSAVVPLERLALGELGGWIVLQAVVGDVQGRWLLDTGASRNLVSPAVAQRLGLVPKGRVQADTPLGAVQGGEVQLPVIAVGGVRRSRQGALVIELQRVLGQAAEGIDGVLGVPWFEGQLAELDLHAWTARFQAHADTTGGMAGQPIACPPPLQAVALTRHLRLPVVTVELPTGSERYVLDTGNPAGLIRIEAERAGATTPGLAISGDLWLTVLVGLNIGPQVRRDLPVVRMTAPALRRSLDPVIRGLAGTAMLDEARWRFDLSNEQLCVEGGQFATPGGFGLLPQRQGSTLVVERVLPASPADRAGIRAGETLHRWMGLPPQSAMADLWQALQGQETLRLIVGEPPREVALRRALFAPRAP
jgi:hypothetical protein